MSSANAYQASVVCRLFSHIATSKLLGWYRRTFVTIRSQTLSIYIFVGMSHHLLTDVRPEPFIELRFRVDNGHSTIRELAGGDELLNG